MKELQVQVPWWLRNSHVQTLLAHLLPVPRLPCAAVPHVIPLPDGDAVVVHDAQPPDWKPGGRMALLIHGLGGSHRSAEVTRLSRRLVLLGVRAIRMDLRGCGAGIPLARKSYHAGSSEDVRHVIQALLRWSPTSPLWLIGISLGGNVVLKLAGEQGTQIWPQLERVVALSPPIDVPRCSALLSQRSNRLYEKHFVNLLVQLAMERHRLFPDLPRLAIPARPSMRQFDELVTAPMHGFADAAAYYQHASSQPHIENIRVPTLILTARDDPFIAFEPFERLAAGPLVEVHVVPHGGHLGFLGWSSEGGLRWSEPFVLNWLFQAPRRVTPASLGA